LIKSLLVLIAYQSISKINKKQGSEHKKIPHSTKIDVYTDIEDSSIEVSMARQLRIIKQNVTYHCYSRCIENRDLFESVSTKEIVLKSITKGLQYYNFKVVYIEFAKNHIHILIKTLPNEASISKIMQYIKARITEYFNRSIGRTGTFWNERFKSEIVEDSKNPQEKFLHLIWYLAYHSVRSGEFIDPRENRYSAINVYLRQKSRITVPIYTHDYFSILNENESKRLKIFKSYEYPYLHQRKYFRRTKNPDLP
jgi:putative transposase